MGKNREPMSEEKAKRIAVGATVGGVLLLVFLLVVLIVQFVQIGVNNAEKARLDKQIAEYEALIESGNESLEYYQTERGLYYLARQQGWG